MTVAEAADRVFDAVPEAFRLRPSSLRPEWHALPISPFTEEDAFSEAAIAALVEPLEAEVWAEVVASRGLASHGPGGGAGALRRACLLVILSRRVAALAGVDDSGRDAYRLVRSGLAPIWYFLRTRRYPALCGSP